jgi:tetratricopeptide (TPR) repeat protein
MRFSIRKFDRVMKDWSEAAPTVVKAFFNSKTKRFWVCVLMLAIGAGIYFGGAAALKAVHEWQSERLGNLSIEYAKKNQWQEASMSAETALRLNPNQPVALRQMAAFAASRGENAEARIFYERLSISGGATKEDLRGYAFAALRSGYGAEAKQIAAFLKEKGDEEFPLLLEAQELAANNEYKGVLEKLRQAASLQGADTAKLELARFLIANPNAETRRELAVLLNELSTNIGLVGAEALAMSFVASLVDTQSAPDRIQKLRNHPARTNDMELVADMAEASINPVALDDITERMKKRLAGAPIKDRVSAARWILAVGRPEVALSLIPDFRASPDSMSLWIDAEAAQGRWESIAEELAKDSNPLPPHLALLYKGRALMMSGNEVSKVRPIFEEALSKSSASPDTLAETLAFLMASGEQDLFAKGFKTLFQNPQEAGANFDNFIFKVRGGGDALLMLDLFQMAQSASAPIINPNFADGADYYRLVLGKPIDVRLLEQRLKDDQGNQSTKYLQAFSLLRSNREKNSLAIVEEITVDPRSMTSQQNLIAALIYAANGRMVEANQRAELIPTSTLTIQELNLLNTCLSQPAR